MKRLISVTLVVVLLFAFAGCDAVVEGLQNLSGSTNPADSVRTTITKEEWLAAKELGNFTVHMVGRKDEQSAILHTEHTESSRYCYEQIDGQEDEYYYTKIDDVIYSIRKEGVGYVARKTSSVSFGVKFGDIFSSIGSLGAYGSLVYDEEAKAYKYDYTDSDNQQYNFTFFFENGNIKSSKIIWKFSSVVVTYDVYDFGTTVIELPEFTFSS